MRNRLPLLSLVVIALTAAAPATSWSAPSEPAAAPRGVGRSNGRVETLFEAFDVGDALASAALADEHSRSPGGPGYESVARHFAATLREAGFGTSAGLSLEWVETPLDAPAWSARAGRVTLLDAEGGATVLHAFSSPGDVDRAIVPPLAPAADLVGDVVFELADLGPGTVLVTESSVRPDLVRRALRRGAAAIVSASLATFNVDPLGGGVHPDAVQLRELEPGPALPVFQISPASFDAIRDASEPRLALFADVVRSAPVAHTVVATIEGRERPDEAVVLAAHLQGAGVSDAAGAASGLLEAARASARLVRAQVLAAPERSLVFVFGPERLQIGAWLECSGAVPVAAIGVLGIGTGPAVLERAPDPESDADLDCAPSALAAIARCATDDVAATFGGWRSGEQPYEGGSDLDVLLELGVPGVLFWSPPAAFARTSLDRWERLDPDELRCGAVAALATAWAVADPTPEELSRYWIALEAERRARMQRALSARHSDVADDWQRWFAGAGTWLALL